VPGLRLSVAVAMTSGLLVSPRVSVAPQSPPFRIANIAREAGLDMTAVFGGRDTNVYLVETTGTGVAMIDYDGEGLVDLLFVNGSTRDGFPRGAEPTNHLSRNRGDRPFEDVTVKAGLGAAAIVDRVDVRWPNGGEEHWTHLAADRLHTIVEGIR
jgi:hypothetical protein